MKTALITGATEGIGYELTKLFAKDKYNLVIIARNEKKLKQIATNYKNTTIIVKDLSKPNSAQEIYQELKKRHIKIDVLVNNAGCGVFGAFKKIDVKKQLDMLQLNVVTLTCLTKLILKDMKKGKILNIASTAAFMPGPLMAVYHASKAYVLFFSQALSNELQPDITVTALCPGLTKSKFHARAKMSDLRLFKMGWMDAETVAKIGYEGLMNNKQVIVPGLKNKIQVFFVKLLPKKFIMNFLKWLYRN